MGGDGMNVLRAITYYLMVSSAVTQMIVQLFMALVWDLEGGCRNINNAEFHSLGRCSPSYFYWNSW